METETETADECTGNAINGKYVEALDTFYSHRDMITARRETVAIVLKRIRNMEQVLRFIIFVYQQKTPFGVMGRCLNGQIYTFLGLKLAKLRNETKDYIILSEVLRSRISEDWKVGTVLPKDRNS